MTRSTLAGMQKDAWSYYGFAGSDFKPVGEVRYVIGWMAEQMTRLDWDVTIAGSEKWTVTTPAETTINTRQADGTEDVTKASAELLELVTWNDTNVKSVTTNLFVAGQGDYVSDARIDGEDEVASGQWRVISVMKKKRKEIIERATERVPFIWPHPADEDIPDAPLFGVLRVLDALDWLDRQGINQSKQRALVNGIIASADGFDKPGEASFWDKWNANLSAKMVNPDDMSPIRITGPLDLIKDGINWIVPDYGYDDVLDQKITMAINRLAYGLPVPPEILLGMQAQSRATAFQVEENAYRAHIEPPAWMVAQVAEDALKIILDREDVKVIPNPTNLLARRNSVQDVKDAYDRGLVTREYLREVLGIPEDAAPEPELDGVPPAGKPSVAEPDPANVAADEPVVAAASTDLSALLSDIDFHLSSELAGATAMATDRARQRLGASARVNKTVRDDPEWKQLSNAALASEFGVEGLTVAGVDIDSQIAEPLDSLTTWWARRVQEAWKQTATLIPGWSGQDAWVTESSEQLMNALKSHVVVTLHDPVAPPLEAEQIRNVVNAAAGGGV